MDNDIISRAPNQKKYYYIDLLATQSKITIREQHEKLTIDR